MSREESPDSGKRPDKHGGHLLPNGILFVRPEEAVVDMHFSTGIPKGVGDDASSQGPIEEQRRKVRRLFW